MRCPVLSVTSAWLRALEMPTVAAVSWWSAVGTPADLHTPRRRFLKISALIPLPTFVVAWGLQRNGTCRERQLKLHLQLIPAASGPSQTPSHRPVMSTRHLYPRACACMRPWALHCRSCAHCLSTAVHWSQWWMHRSSPVSVHTNPTRKTPFFSFNV